MDSEEDHAGPLEKGGGGGGGSKKVCSRRAGALRVRSWPHRCGPQNSKADKRAHHNALERKRRDHIKDSFTVLRDSIPQLVGEKSSRAQILNKATEFIEQLRGKNEAHRQEMVDLERENDLLASQGRELGAQGGPRAPLTASRRRADARPQSGGIRHSRLVFERHGYRKL